MSSSIAADQAAVAFFEALRTQHASAVDRCGRDQRTFRIHDSTISVDCAGRIPSAFLKALEHRSVETNGLADLSIQILDSEATGVRIPKMPWSAEDIRELGLVRGYNSARFYTNFNVISMLLVMIDLQQGDGFLWHRMLDEVAFWESSAPLRQFIAAWYAMHKNAHLVHAAVAGAEGRSVMLAGLSGSGKSTTAAACMCAGMEYLGDDYTMISLGPVPTAHSVYSTAKLYPHDLNRFPHLQQLFGEREGLHDGKVVYYLDEVSGANLVAESRLQAIVIPVVTGEKRSKLEPASPATALKALAPSTIFQLWGPSQVQFSFLSELVRKLPCYRLKAGTDVAELPDLILDLLEKLDGR